MFGVLVGWGDGGAGGGWTAVRRGRAPRQLQHATRWDLRAGADGPVFNGVAGGPGGGGTWCPPQGWRWRTGTLLVSRAGSDASRGQGKAGACDEGYEGNRASDSLVEAAGAVRHEMEKFAGWYGVASAGSGSFALGSFAAGSDRQPELRSRFTVNPRMLMISIDNFARLDKRSPSTLRVCGLKRRTVTRSRRCRRASF